MYFFSILIQILGLNCLRDLINQVKEGDNPDYCHRVTADDRAVGE